MWAARVIPSGKTWRLLPVAVADLACGGGLSGDPCNGMYRRASLGAAPVRPRLTGSARSAAYDKVALALSSASTGLGSGRCARVNPEHVRTTQRAYNKALQRAARWRHVRCVVRIDVGVAQ